MGFEKLGQVNACVNPDQTRIQQLYAIGAASLAESREQLHGLPPVNFVTLLIANFDALDNGELGHWTKGLIDAGSRYFCAWGNRCDLAHEIFDEECSMFESDEESVIMTTDHRDDSIDDAIWFALNCAVPAPPYDRNWNAILAVSIDDAESLDRLRAVFAEPTQFCEQHDT